jgi:hypothetical protein
MKKDGRGSSIGKRKRGSSGVSSSLLALLRAVSRKKRNSKKKRTSFRRYSRFRAPRVIYRTRYRTRYRRRYMVSSAPTPEMREAAARVFAKEYARVLLLAGIQASRGAGVGGDVERVAVDDSDFGGSSARNPRSYDYDYDLGLSTIPHLDESDVLHMFSSDNGVRSGDGGRLSTLDLA